MLNTAIVGLFCRNVGLFCRYVGLFCRNVGLYCLNVGTLAVMPCSTQHQVQSAGRRSTPRGPPDTPHWRLCLPPATEDACKTQLHHPFIACCRNLRSPFEAKRKQWPPFDKLSFYCKTKVTGTLRERADNMDMDADLKAAPPPTPQRRSLNNLSLTHTPSLSHTHAFSQDMP